MGNLIFAILAVLLLSIDANAVVPVARAGIDKDAEIITVSGEGRVRFLREMDWQEAMQEQILTAGDAVRTGALGRMAILFIDGAQIKVHNRTTITIKDAGKPGSGAPTVLDLETGEVWSRTPSSPDSLRINTPSATAAIRGTDWDLLVDAKGSSYLTVLKGTVELYNASGSVSVGANEQAMAEIGKAPVKTFLVRPKDRVQWIISYPIEIADIVSFQNHRRADALKAIPEAKSKAANTEGRLFLAELLYDVKERGECAKITDEVLASEPGNSRALLLKGYLHLGKKETESARSFFLKALENAPERGKILASLGLAGAHLQNNQAEDAGKLLRALDTEKALAEIGVALAHFLAYQGSFTEAIDVSSKYGKRYPKDERFPIMIADFSLTLDEVEKARAATETALLINPDSSMAQTILGRGQYLQGDSKEAEQSFRRAIETDQANTIAMSELGKLLMERGHFEESQQTFGAAIERDPNVSSYWSRRGMLMNWVENLDAARADLEKASGMNATDYQSFNALGVIALKEGRTEEASRYFLKAGVMEPNYAEPHIFLAIAYYQLDQIGRALDELKVAKALDPKDPVPHIITYIIQQDIYRPMDAVLEATAALELLPNLKSVNPAQDTKRGLSNLGNALLGLGMDEWAGSYAEQSFDLFDAASYRFVSNRFQDNPIIYESANFQSFLLNPMSIGFDNRYQDIVLRPQHNFHLGTRLGSEEGELAGTYTLIQEGYVRKPFEIDYLLQIDLHNNEGFRDNADSEGYFATFGVGGRPDYQNGFFAFGHVAAKEMGDPGTKTAPDNDNYTKQSSYSINAGYNRRLGPKNNLLVNLYASNLEVDFHNRDPLGTAAGITDLEASFIKGLGLERARQLFRDGLYEVDFSIPWYATDATGILGNFFPAVFADIPKNLDTDFTRRSETTLDSTGLQLKHIVEVNDVHQLSFGLELMEHNLESRLTESMSQEFLANPPFASPTIVFTDEILGGATVTPIAYYAPRKISSRSIWLHGDTFMVYANDRWKPTDNFLVEAGLFFESYEDEFNDSNTFNPRAGFSWKFHPNHILRAAYQRRLIPSDPTFAPFTTAGVGFEYPQMQLYPGAKLEDYRTSIESRWNNWLFTELRYERRDLEIPQISSFIDDYDNRADIFSVAANAIVTDQIGVFARYKNTNNRNLNGFSKDNEMPYEPENTFGAGIMWVSPSYIKATLATRYTSEQFTDFMNMNGKVPAYWATDFNFTWEPFDKHLLVSLDAKNIFDTYYETNVDVPGMGRSYYLTMAYRF